MATERDVPADDGAHDGKLSLGERVKTMRARSGMSQADLASRAGVSASYISLIEAGQRTPSDEALRQLSQSLGVTQAELLGAAPADPVVVEMALSHARADTESGHARRALRNLESVLRRYPTSLDWDLECRIRVARAAARYKSGGTERALAELEELLTEQVPPTVLTSLLNTLSACYLDAGDVARAIDLAQRGLDQLNSAESLPVADFVGLGVTLASAYRARGDLASAESVSRRVLGGAERDGSPQTRGKAYLAASLNAESAGDKLRALTLAARALGAFGEGEASIQVARMQLAYARILLSIGPERCAEATRLLDKAQPVLRTAGTAAEAAQCQLQVARVHLATGNPHLAIQIAEDVVATAAKMRLEAAYGRLIIAQAHTATGRPDEARQALSAAYERLLTEPPSWSAAQVWRELGDLYAQAESADIAMEAYRHALLMAGIPPA